MAADDFRKLTVYKKAFELAMAVFRITSNFPKDERYSLTDQMRRSSRSVCSCIGEAYSKKHYEGYFVNKTSDADGENTETRVWLDFSIECNYISKDVWAELELKAVEVGKLLNHMIAHPEKYVHSSTLRRAKHTRSKRQKLNSTEKLL